MSLTRRQQVLGGLFVLTGLLTLAILSRVLGTVFFAITVAYVLYPVRRELVRRQVPRRVAAGVATVVGFVFVALIVAPLVAALYLRRDELLAFIRNVPPEIPVTVFEMTFVVDVSQVLTQARDAVVSVGVALASATPVLALKGFLFLILVYGLLLRPENVREATVRIVPGEYHDVTFALHRRVRDTLYALYVLQAATALGTFVVAYVVFWALGFDAAFSLAVLSGLLQFIPVVGPSLLVALVAAGQLLAGEVATAVLVTVVGLVFVGFLPDALIRPRLASITTGMPASLYFVGFTGGTLTVGVVGVIAGPLVVALLAEVIRIITEERGSVQQTLDTAKGERAAPRRPARDEIPGDTWADDGPADRDRTDGPAANGPAADGPAADGPAADGDGVYRDPGRETDSGVDDPDDSDDERSTDGTTADGDSPASDEPVHDDVDDTDRRAPDLGDDRSGDGRSSADRSDDDPADGDRDDGDRTDRDPADGDPTDPGDANAG